MKFAVAALIAAASAEEAALHFIKGTYCMQYSGSGLNTRAWATGNNASYYDYWTQQGYTYGLGTCAGAGFDKQSGGATDFGKQIGMKAPVYQTNYYN